VAQHPGHGAERTGADLVARLAAADPAAGVEPDLARLRAAVEERRRAAPADELAARRLRRLTTWPARAAAVAAAALVVGGGGGYAVGLAAAGGGGDATTADAPIVLEAPGGAGSVAEAAPDLAGAADVDGGRGGYDATWGGWYGRTVFHASGLTGGATSATAWALDATSVSGQAAAAAAEALGVPGEPRLEYGSWVVGPNDGNGPTVQLMADGAGSLSFWDPTVDVWYCGAVPERSAREGEAAAEPAPDAPVSDGGGVDPVAPDVCDERDLGDAPSAGAAEDALREAMASLGVDPAAFEFAVEDVGDRAHAYVTAYHVLDGQRTGLAWNASFTGAGMASLYGFTATLVELGEYDVVPPAEAVERLNDPRFGAGWSGPVILAGGARDAMEVAPVPEEPDGVPPTPARPGAAFAWPVRDVTIVAARLGLAQLATGDGATVLAPSYELTADDGSVWSVIAVAERHLDLSAD